MPLTVFLLLVVSAVSAAEPTVTLPTPLGAHAAQWAAAQGAGAVVTAERVGGEWRYALGGAAFPAGHAAVAPERIEFEIGSISKVFTGLLLAHAAREGKLALTDTIAERLPVKFDSPDVGRITLRQLATHTSCLLGLPTKIGASDPYAEYDDDALFARLAQVRFAKTPPCEVDYSNFGFSVLGVILERAYGKPWETLVREKITAPLGMSDTAQNLSAEQKSRFAQAWDGDTPAQPWTFKAAAGAGALRSTAADMAKFAEALCAGTKGPLKDVWMLMTGDEVAAGGLGGRVGLGLIHDRVGGEDSYGHNGGTGGFRSALRVYPGSGRAVIVLASNGKAQPDAWLAVWRAEGQPAVVRKEVALPSAALDEYAGIYSLSRQNRFTVLKVGDGLRARLTGQPFLPLFPSARDEFFYKEMDAQISFQRDADGKLIGLTLHQNGRDMAAPRSADPVPHVEFPTGESLQQYAGEYDFGSYQPGATISVSVEDDIIGAQLTGQPMLFVFATGKDRFEYDVVEATLTFERDAAGEIVAVVLHKNGKDMRSPRK